MSRFPLHTLATAPLASRASLETLAAAFGFVPNVAAAMATSPVLLSGLTDLFARVHGGSYAERDIQVLLLTNAVTNGAAYAVALHTVLALKHGLAREDVEAIRTGGRPHDRQAAALSRLARRLIETRGRIGDAEAEAFLAAGYTPSHLLEAVLVTAASTVTNYTTNITAPPLEPAFADHAWDGPSRASAA